MGSFVHFQHFGFYMLKFILKNIDLSQVFTDSQHLVDFSPVIKSFIPTYPKQWILYKLLPHKSFRIFRYFIGICEHLGTTLLTGKKLKINGNKRTGVFIVNLEQICHIFLPFQLLILNK